MFLSDNKMLFIYLLSAPCRVYSNLLQLFPTTDCTLNEIFSRLLPCIWSCSGWEIIQSVHPDTGVNTQWRREWSESSRHVCSSKWAVPRCTSTTRRAGGWTWTGCAPGMAATTASPSTTSSRAPGRPASYTSEEKILCLSACSNLLAQKNDKTSISEFLPLFASPLIVPYLPMLTAFTWYILLIQRAC